MCAYLIIKVTVVETRTRAHAARLVSMPVSSAGRLCPLTSFRLYHCMGLNPPSACSLCWTRHTRGCPSLGSLSYSSSHLVFKAGGSHPLNCLITFETSIHWFRIKRSLSVAVLYICRRAHIRAHTHTDTDPHTLTYYRVQGFQGREDFISMTDFLKSSVSLTYSCSTSWAPFIFPDNSRSFVISLIQSYWS